ncbi:MAG TPA: nuclear transport factor 2 family protein [Steroidobacteraceae bacterium]|nr:nuclear transport factor 2 family protein [Steroidobacteraceae bacterium]
MAPVACERSGRNWVWARLCLPWGYRRLISCAASAVMLVGLAAGRACAAHAGDEPRTIARLRAQLAVLSSEAARIEDANAVKKLQRAYGYYLDKGYWGEAAALFADGATMEVGIDGVYVGKDHILKRLMLEGGGNPGPGLPYGQIYHRMQLQPVVDIAPDGKTAKGRWREIALLGHYHQDAEWGAGIYENEYVKQNGVWEISKLHYYPSFIAPYEGGWAKLQPVTDDWTSSVGRAFPADRPATVRYQPFPAMFTPPFHYPAAPSAGAPDPPAGAVTAAGTGELGALQASVAHSARELALVRSHDLIENLQAAYGYYIDKGLWDKAAALFAADATYEYGQQGVYVGRKRIRKALALMGPEGLEQGELNDYPMLQPIIDVASDNRTAKARWRSDVMLARDGKAEWGEGEYENDYVNDGGIWRISKLHFYVTFFADYDQGWGGGEIPLQGPSTRLPPDRPPTEVYRSLPGVYVPRYHYANPIADAEPSLEQDVSGASGLPASLLSLQASANALAHRVELLADHAQIEKIQRAYGYYVDKAQWPDIAKLFAADGTYEIGGRGIFVGPKRVLEYLVTGLGPIGMATRTGQILNHQQFQGIVDVAPDGASAWGRWTAIIMGGSAHSALWGDALYENTYVKERGVWKFKTVRAAFNMYAPYKGGWRDGSVPNTRPDSFAPPPDLAPSVVYLTYPSFYLLPFHYPNPVTGRAPPPPNPAAGGVAPMSLYAPR